MMWPFRPTQLLQEWGDSLNERGNLFKRTIKFMIAVFNDIVMKIFPSVCPDHGILSVQVDMKPLDCIVLSMSLNDIWEGSIVEID